MKTPSRIHTLVALLAVFLIGYVTGRYAAVSGRSGSYRGNIQYVRLPDKASYIKRVIGLPGQTVAITDGKVMIN
jgi:signal peptidase I